MSHGHEGLEPVTHRRAVEAEQVASDAFFSSSTHRETYGTARYTPH
jgi:hypothetical protein